MGQNKWSKLKLRPELATLSGSIKGKSGSVLVDEGAQLRTRKDGYYQLTRAGRWLEWLTLCLQGLVDTVWKVVRQQTCQHISNHTDSF